MDIAVTCLL